MRVHRLSVMRGSSDNLGVVVIGRNEGTRLAACLDSVLKVIALSQVVYVDSDSTDDSVDIAQQKNVHVLELTKDKPFTAGRARNAGFQWLSDNIESLEFVQFLDGDSELSDNWLEDATLCLNSDSAVAICSGILTEINPSASIYNQLCEIEWHGAAGNVDSCGGIFMSRASVFAEVAGFKEFIIAGEEPELCLRIRQFGCVIRRLDKSMARHDANITSFTQWATRAKRSGYAYAQGAHLHGASAERYNLRELASIFFWSTALPAAIISGCVLISVGALTCLLIYPAKLIQIFFRYNKSYENRLAAAYSVFTMLAKFFQVGGVMSYLRRELDGRKHLLVEYK